ncbi:MAG: PAS domain-containing protein [Anaerolineae bacterium]|nr:PAS domain-containing protein [Anaerolineae bacterium]
MTEDNPIQTQQAYAQAKKYGKELAQLYAVEKARRKELETTTQKLQAIFDTAPNALAVVDKNLTIVEANPRFLLLFEQDDCIGCPLTKLLPAEPIRQTLQLMATKATNLGSVEVEITQPVPHTLLVALAPLSDGESWVLILHDLTERKRLEGLKDEFINIAAHELRTPLGGVMGFVSVLRENLQEYNDPMLLHISDLILESTERLKTIIDELVEFATAQRNPGDGLHIVDINVNWLLQKSVKYLQKQIQAQNITYRFEIPSVTLTVRGDQFILSEVIYQLLKNAVIFNKPGGKIVIRVQRLPLATFPDMATNDIGNNSDQEITLIEIEDTGIGIPQTDLENIFEKFYQVKEHLTRDVGGLGLGLTIARQGVEQHNGRLTVTSKLGEGSTFRIILPPITQLRDVSVDSRVNLAHQQTLAYAKDMARAVASQLKMKKILQQVEALSTDLSQNLTRLSTAEPGSTVYINTLNQVQNINQMLLELSRQKEEQ